VLLLATALLIVVWRAGFLDLLDTEKFLSLDTAQAYLIAAAAILTPALTIWGLLRGVSRWIFATSARGARRFIDNTRDPMRLVDDHVRDLVSWTGRNVIVLIDDLDRCKGPYVVELLEGIQTLFRDVPVTFVVAADRDWLADSYGAEYKKFLSATDQPGRPLGHLFLEKTFQISVGLPAAGAQLDAYWNRLLRSADLPDEEELDRAREAAVADLVQRPSDEARRLIVAKPGTTVAEVQARREVVAVEMASARAAQEAAHTLEPFRDLLGRDANPRAMKRLINAFGIARGVETLHGYNLEGDLKRERETALWAILNLRWRKLGDHLAKYPANVDLVGSKAPARVPRDLIPLFMDDDVIDVVRGKGVDACLDEPTVHSVRLFSA